MIKNILFSLTLIVATALTVQGQNIAFHDYGAGLAFPINEVGEFDFDEDGLADFSINSQQGKLGIKPILNNGCVHAFEGFNSDVNGVRIRVLEEGAYIQYAGSFDMYFEEDEPLPLYDDVNEFADWDDGQAQYIGLLSYNFLYPGWMKVRVDVENETLYIMSYAYNKTPGQGIATGEGAATPLDVPEIKSINDVSIFPNPVSNQLNVEVDLVEASSVEFLLKSMNGQQVRSQVLDLNAGVHQTGIDVNDLANGIYQLTIQSNGEFISRSVMIGR